MMSNSSALCFYQIDSFTGEKFKGNPAGVVPQADNLTDNEMQQIARELNNSETVFILKPDAEDHDIRLRFFTPTTEVPSCGHATIAANFVRATEFGHASGVIRQKTLAGINEINITKHNDRTWITMTQGRPKIQPKLPEDICHSIEAALGISGRERLENYPLRIASTGHSKVMIALRSKAYLNSLKPDFSALGNLSKVIGCNGYYAFALNENSSEYLVSGRMFAPAIGIQEDPVTGNANGPLGAYLVAQGHSNTANGTFTFKARQGVAMGREGEIEVSVEVKSSLPLTVRISGTAVCAFKGYF